MNEANLARFMTCIDRDVRVADMTPCWIWQKSIASSGYGQICFQNVRWNAHRYSYYAHNGFVELPEKLHVCHRCDVKECCNPEHLYLGSAKQNAKDTQERIMPPKKIVVKIRNSTPCYNCVETHSECSSETEDCDRCVRLALTCEHKPYVATEGCFKSDATAGEKNVKAKLNWEIVKEIRRRQAEGLKYGQIKAMALEFGVSEISIQNILRNKTWIVV